MFARSLCFLCLVLFAACGVPAGEATPAPIGAHDASGTALQLVAGTDLCVDTAYDSASAGASIQMWLCDGLSNQSWSSNGNRLTLFGNMCLQSDSAPLQIQPCDNTNGQQQFTWNGNALVASNGQCVTAAAANQGAAVQLAPCDSTNTLQAWTLAPVGNSNGIPSDSNSIATNGNTRTVQVINKCAQTVYAGAYYQQGQAYLPNNGGWQMEPGTTNTFTIPVPWSGRFWARTGCTFDASGHGSCATGDCNGQLQCGTLSAQPASLAEFGFDGYQGMDFYDVSLVEGFNLPISVAPAPGSFSGSDGSQYSCGAPACNPNLLTTCPSTLQHNVNGEAVACYNACFAVGGDAYCCSGNYSSRETCGPNQYSEFFKAACPNAYSYPFDDPTSVYACSATTYLVTFCP